MAVDASVPAVAHSFNWRRGSSMVHLEIRPEQDERITRERAEAAARGHGWRGHPSLVDFVVHRLRLLMHALAR